MPTNARPLAAGLLALAALLPAGCFHGSPVDWVIEQVQPEPPGIPARKAFSPDPDERREAILTLSAASFGDAEPYLKLYRLSVTYPDASVRAAAIHALGSHGAPEDVPAMNQALHDSDRAVRWEAARTLQRLHNPAAVEPLLKTLAEDEEPDVRREAATALGQYAQPAVVTALISSLDDSDFSVVDAAGQSLTTLTGQELGTDATQWLSWSEQHKGQWFAGQRIYKWQPWVRPSRWYDTLVFWKSHPVPPPREPAGMTPVPAATQPSS